MTFDELDTEAAHLFAGMCMSHHLFAKSEMAYTCTLYEGHDGMHQSVGPAGEVYALWVHY